MGESRVEYQRCELKKNVRNETAISQRGVHGILEVSEKKKVATASNE
jgi:hypothetical protein